MLTYINSNIIQEYRAKARSIPDTIEFNRVIDFIASPESVYKMICATKMGFPALTGICRDLCDFCSNFKEFPLTNYTNRQHVGRIIKYVMAQYGYAPRASGLDPQCRIPACAQTNPILFQTSAIYEEITEDPVLSLTVTSYPKQNARNAQVIEAAKGYYRLGFSIPTDSKVTIYMIRTLMDPFLMKYASIMSGFSIEVCDNSVPPCSLVISFRPDDLSIDMFNELKEELTQIFTSLNLTFQEAPCASYFKTLWITKD